MLILIITLVLFLGVVEGTTAIAAGAVVAVPG
jgi:hypothetical protein